MDDSLPRSAALRAIAGAIAGFLYGCLLSFLAIGAAGGGHGTLVALLMSAAPLASVYVADTQTTREVALTASIYGAPFLWAMLGLLVALPGGKGPRLVLVLLLLHYASGLAVVVIAGASPLGMAGRWPEVFLMWAPIYVVGQIALWWQIIRRRQSRPAA